MVAFYHKSLLCHRPEIQETSKEHPWGSTNLTSTERTEDRPGEPRASKPKEACSMGRKKFVSPPPEMSNSDANARRILSGQAW